MPIALHAPAAAFAPVRRRTHVSDMTVALLFAATPVLILGLALLVFGFDSVVAMTAMIPTGP